FTDAAEPRKPSRLSSPLGYLFLSFVLAITALLLAATQTTRWYGITLALAAFGLALVAAACSLARKRQALGTMLAAVFTSATALFVAVSLPRPATADSADSASRTDAAAIAFTEEGLLTSNPVGSKYASIGSVLAIFPGHLVVLHTPGTIEESVDEVLKKL